MLPSVLSEKAPSTNHIWRFAIAIGLCLNASAAFAQQTTTTKVDGTDNLNFRDVARGLMNNYATSKLTQPPQTQGVLQGTVERTDMRIKRQQPLFQDPRFFSDVPQNGPPTNILNPQVGSVNQNALDTQARGTYVWSQSGAGGYYDATGQTKEVVPGDQLYKWGGKLQDGAVIPPYPVVCNFAKHVYRPFIRKQQ